MLCILFYIYQIITTHSGAHVRDAADLKRVMNTVIMSLIPALIFGMFNAGFQHYGQINGFPQDGMAFLSTNFWNLDNLLVGASKILTNAYCFLWCRFRN